MTPPPKCHVSRVSDWEDTYNKVTLANNQTIAKIAMKLSYVQKYGVGLGFRFGIVWSVRVEKSNDAQKLRI